MIRAVGTAALAAALAWVLAGCDGFQTRNVDPKPMRYEDLQTKAQQKEAGEKPGDRPVIETPVTGDPTSPRRCYELYRQAIRQRDFNACWALLSGPSKDAHETAASDLKLRVINAAAPSGPDMEILGILGFTRADADKLTGKMFMTGSMERQTERDPEGFSQITRTEYDHEAIWGDRAVVYVRIRDQRQPEGMRVVREGNLWHIDMRPARPSD